MAEKNNATCSICGNDYHLCLSCKDSIQLAPWKVHTDTAEHYKIFQIIRGFSTGVYTKGEAKNKLKNVDLSDLSSFRPNIKKVIKDILKEEDSVEKPIEKVEVAKTETTEVVDNVVVKDIKENIRPTTFRKKNYKVEVK